MITSNKTTRQLYEELKAKPKRSRYGFGVKPALINIDVQRAFVDSKTFDTAYENNPRQIEYINRLAQLCRERRLPVIWTQNCYVPSGEDCGVRGTRATGPDAVQNLTDGSVRAEIDPRCEVERSDIVMKKRQPSGFFETNLCSLLVFHRVDTVIVTGGSTSGCVRGTVVDGMSNGYRMIVPEECVADRHESPHFGSLYDMSQKYGDVVPYAEVEAYLLSIPGNRSAA